MKRSTKFVALDVRQECAVAAVREENGRVIARAIVPTEEPRCSSSFRGMRGSIHVAFEEGTQAQWLHDLLVPGVQRVIVCDRRGERRQETRATGSTPISSLTDFAAELCAPSITRVLTVPHSTTSPEPIGTWSTMPRGSCNVSRRSFERAIRSPARRVYHPEHRAEWLSKLPDRPFGSRPKPSMPSWTCCVSCDPRRRPPGHWHACRPVGTRGSFPRP